MINQASPLKKTARRTGALYFLLSLTGIYGLMYVPSQIIVQGDDAATCQNMLSHEFLFRSGVAVSAISNVIYLYLALMFYKLFRNVNEFQAKLLVALVVADVAISFILDAFNMTSLLVLKGDVLKSLTTQQAQDLAIVFRRARGNGIQLSEIFWGLWLFPMGVLSYKSGFIPRIIGVLVIIAGCAYLIESFTFILFPVYEDEVNKWMMPLFTGELFMVFWLLIWGVKKGY